ncbi:UNVERIFIED_CONTAM: Cyclin-SDS [Sesamum radiatum]|uniref:Cyclin-SDS n=1 Tax=Sesamum radiatum TaxID=300843 RepID=A0AAW2TZV7_SESRA
MKRKLKAKAVAEVEASLGEEQPLYFTRKQLRSRFSRRRRIHISPIVLVSGTDSHVTAASEISCDSSIASVSNQNPPDLRSEFRRVVTRAYYRKNFKKENRNCDEALELSDTSCVESSSGPNRVLSLKSGNVERLEVKGGEVAKSEVTSTSRFSFPQNDAGKVKENNHSVQITHKEVVSEIPGRDNSFCEEITNLEAGKCILLDNKAVSIHSVQRSINISENRAMSEELRLPKLALDVDLSCSEQFSNGGVINDGEEEEEHNSSSSQIFQVVSDSELESSEYSPSFWSYASGSQFSEKSIGDESSPTFELFRQFKQQFCRSTFDLKAFDDHNSHEINLGLEDEEEEESYRMMKKRERRQEYVHDYAQEYCNTTEYGELVIQQRLHMVHWIVEGNAQYHLLLVKEQARNKELQKETLFLGVNLLDRFLSKGYFKNMRNLQIAGIACLTLATRIEENQPYNCIRKKTFSVGSTLYGRCEVVAMEWLIQEVLNFQCFLPTLYNFLWFYLKAARANEDVEKTAKYLAVLTLMGRQQLCYCPSTVAAGLVIVASVATNQDASCHLVATIHARQKDKDLPECIKSLEWLVKYL